MRPGMRSCSRLAANVTEAYLGRSSGDAGALLATLTNDQELVPLSAGRFAFACPFSKTSRCAQKEMMISRLRGQLADASPVNPTGHARTHVQLHPRAEGARPERGPYGRCQQSQDFRTGIGSMSPRDKKKKSCCSVLIRRALTPKRRADSDSILLSRRSLAELAWMRICN